MGTYKIVSQQPPVIFITGCFGFLGRHVAREYANQGWCVVGLGHHGMSESEQTAWGIDTAIVDHISADLIAATAEKHGAPSVLFHAAGAASVGLSWQDTRSDFARTVAVTEDVVEAVRRLPGSPLLIYPSSAAVYGVDHTKPISENDALRPISPYGLNKLLAEQLLCGAARLYGIRCAVVRFFSLYGTDLRKQILWDICQRLAHGESPLSLGGSGLEARDFLYGPDAARIIYALRDVSGEEPLIVNGSHGTPTSVAELANGLLTTLGIDTDIVFSNEIRKGDPAYLVADTTRLNEIGFTPNWSLEQGLTDYSAWIRAAIDNLPHGNRSKRQEHG